MKQNSLIEAIETMIAMCSDENQKMGIQSVRKMIEDWNEQGWPTLINRNDWLSRYLNCEPSLHYYKAWVSPRHGYEYPVYFAHPDELDYDEILENAKKLCFFLVVGEEDDLNSGIELTKQEYDEENEDPEEYIQRVYSNEGED